MKKTFAITLFTAFLLLSCESHNENDENLDGHSTDMIGLSEKSISVEKNGAEKKIYTKYDYWSIEAFVDSNHFFIQDAKSGYGKDLTTFTYNGVSIQKEGLKTLKISISENTTGKEKNISILVNSGNYYDYIDIKQSGY